VKIKKYSMDEHILTGFGFGPIQSGLFVKEAFESGNFSRLVVAEIDQTLVDAVRANGGSYYVNVAGTDAIDAVRIEGVEILNPNIEADRERLLAALSESTEIVTSLPSVNFYGTGGERSAASQIARGLSKSSAAATIIYTAENNNHAAEILRRSVEDKGGGVPRKVQFLNTVIGKMSQVVTEAERIEELGLEPIAPGIGRAFLVEQFNHILVTKPEIEGFRPGIEVFVEKKDLLPFEEAKLYGHNAIHALLAYLGAVRGYSTMTELAADAGVMAVGREAFLNESGAALIRKYTDLGDELFTEAGYTAYADDLLRRMTNPFLTDTIARAGRDPVRKLGYNDRIFGTMRLAMEFGIEPENMALGAMAGIATLLANAEENKVPVEMRMGDWRKLDAEGIEAILKWVWKTAGGKEAGRIIECACNSKERLIELADR
jgi:mannitol-1-phosphate 5-dehydrogenase